MTHVWRLHIEYPAEPNAAEVEMWRDAHRSFEGQCGWDRPEWRWPPERLFLSRGGADGRADLLRRLGATVVVERSLPVEWPDPVEADR